MGIYDGSYGNKNGNPMSGRNSKYNSGFNGVFGFQTYDNDTSVLTELTTGRDFPKPKYYDMYAYAENDEFYNRGILGDATGEMGTFGIVTYGSEQRQIGSWYTDESWFVTQIHPWFTRGYHFSVGSDTGVFAFDAAAIGGSFRLVLAI